MVDLTDKQKAALDALKLTGTAVLHVATGSALVRAGKAVKTNRTGCGQLMAEYKAV